MSHPPPPPPGRSGPQGPPLPYGQQPPHSQQPGAWHPQPSIQYGAAAPQPGDSSRDSPGALGLALFLAGFVVVLVPAVIAPIVTQMSLANPGSVSPVAVSGLAAGFRILGLLIGVGGVLTVRSASWTRRGISAGILAATMLISLVLGFALGFIVQQLSVQTTVSIAVAVSVVASTALGALVPVGWITAWLVVRKSPAVGWLIALAVGALVPLVCSALAQLFFARSGGYVGPAIVVTVVQVLCFVAAILLAELFIRRAARKRRELDHLRQSVR